MTEIAEFVTLTNHTNYEILTVYPYTIRKKANHKNIKATVDTNGYLIICLQDVDKRHKYLLHRIIAEQFMPNPNNFPVVDHINHNKQDNHIENLRWCSKIDNDRNRSSYFGKPVEYVKEIDEEAIVVNSYNEHNFEDYYFHNDVFYMFNGITYRKLPIKETHDGYEFVNAIDTNHKKCQIYYSKFKQQYDLI